MLKIGVTGHRNIDNKFLNDYKKKVYSKLLQLKQIDENLILYSSLADGADRLVVYEAMKLNINFIVVLPMDKNEYKKDFTHSSKIEFESLLQNSKDKIVVYNDSFYDRDSLYEKVGCFISNNCDILITLWDGIYNNLKGGTSEIVKYHKINYKKIHHIKVKRF